MMLAWLGLVLAAPSADDLTRLAAGEVVLHDRTARHEGALRVEAVVDIHAGRDAVWAALIDFPARKASNSSLKIIQPYRPATATEQWVKWQAQRFGVTVTYHNHYLLSADRASMIHELDPTMPNDMEYSRGVFTLSSTASCSPCTRLSYDVESDFGVAIPSFVQGWLTGSGVRDFMADLARRVAS
jgi:hypothetical protein